MLHPEGLRADLVASLTVASVAVPLSLAIALASDVPPAVGLVTASVAGIVCGLFGGSRLAVAGPAAAMAVLVGQVVDQHGLGGLLVVGVGAGLLQVLTGVFGFGRVFRLIPASVVHGFTTGIGVLILLGQLPRAFGLEPPDESHVLDVLLHVGRYLHRANPSALLVAAIAAGCTYFLPRLFPRAPAVLIGVALSAGVAVVFGLELPALGAVPRGLPAPSLPAWPGASSLLPLLGDALVVFAVATLESLLSASALDRLTGKGAHDPDQELVGQGLANLASALFGGIPVTSVIARSALNVQAGARTRRASVLHAVFVLAAVYLAAPLVEALPVAALGGVLLGVGARMVSPGYFRELLAASRAEALVYLVTVTVMVAFDLLVGVQAGCVTALIAALAQIGRAGFRVVKGQEGTPHHAHLSGSLTFLAASRLASLSERLLTLDPAHGVILDLRHVDSVDTTAGESLLAMADTLEDHGFRVAVLVPNGAVRAVLERLPSVHGAERRLATSDADLDRLFERSRAAHAHRVLLAGVERFRSEVRSQLSPLLAQLAAGQEPHTFFLTCADSRVSPNLMCGAHPGELFVVRNIGALLPPVDSTAAHPEGAALEYAVSVLGVRNVVLCGHSSCGAITALHRGIVPEELPALARWAESAQVIAGDVRARPSVDEATKSVLLRQLETVRAYPVVREKWLRGQLRVSAWFYDVERADVLEWSETAGAWLHLGETGPSSGGAE